MSTRTIRSYQRRALERLAQEFEMYGYALPRFTCHAVRARLGKRASDAYARAFGLDDEAELSNQLYLWNRSPRTQTKLRVLMLGFAAAMASTGDL